MRFRYFVVPLLLFGGWKALNHWYTFRSTEAYLVFVACFLASIILAMPLFPFHILPRSLSLRYVPIALFCLLVLPYGEWLRLNFSDSREDWSRQLLHQFVFLFVLFGIFNFLPDTVRRMNGVLTGALDRLASKRKVFVLLPILFLLFSLWIAFFVFRSTPLVQDSASHLFQAKIFAQGQMVAPSPPVPDFFSYQGDMLAIANNHWLSIYQPGFALLLAAAMLLHAEYALTPVLGAITIALWIIYLRRWHNDRIALVFGILACLSPFLFVMFSTPMIHSLEVFLCSAAIFLCRSELEKPDIKKRIGIFLVLFFAPLVRSFSILAFLIPVLLYGSWQSIRRRSYFFPILVICGLMTGGVMLGLYQHQAYGNPFLSGYLIEYPGLKYGFGLTYLDQMHTPLRGLEQLSNNLLGLNHWLNGWYAGSLFFVVALFLLPVRRAVWDILFLLCCVTLMLSYFFFVGQDLVIGPRYFFPLAPIALIYLSQLFDPSHDSDSAMQLRLVVAISLITFLPFQLFHHIRLYSPSKHHLIRMLPRADSHSGTKTLIFLAPETDQSFVNLNNPFLNSGTIVCRDFAEKNKQAIAAFPGYRPLYYRLDNKDWKNDTQSSYSLHSDPRPANAPPFLLFHLALRMQQGTGDYDCFDTCYRTVFLPGRSSEEMIFLRQKLKEAREKQEYQQQFKSGLIHSAIFMVLPKLTVERFGAKWNQRLDVAEINRHFDLAIEGFSGAGPVGQPLFLNLSKIQRKIDKNEDQIFSRDELRGFLEEKLQLMGSP